MVLKRSIVILMAFVILLMSVDVNASDIERIAKRDAERIAKTQAESILWYSAGAFCLMFGVAYAYKAEPSSAPLPSYVNLAKLGKSPEYVYLYIDAYKKAYKSEAKKVHIRNAMSGCVMSSCAIVFMLGISSTLH